ncbi:hypothetical protein V2J09_008680 [Rumex salicifolius]
MKLINLLSNSPQFIDLGIASFTMDEPCFPEALMMLARLNGLERLSGLSDVTPYYLPILYPLCVGLSSLDSSNSALHCPDLVKLICHSPNLRRLLVIDFIEDVGLEEVAASCKELQELRVLPSDPYEVDPTIKITERGLVSVAMGCPKLHRILYFYSQLTNAVSLQSPSICQTLHFSWLVQLIPNVAFGLLDLSLTDCWSGLGASATITRRLALLLPGVLMRCAIGGRAILASSDKLERMRFLYLLSCPVSHQTCRLLARKHPRLNVEVLNEMGPLHSMSDECVVEQLYVYRTVAGPRLNMPKFVQNAINEEAQL